MKGKKLLIQKTIFPIDWNPSDPQGYDSWMQMIVKENLKSIGKALEEPKINSIEFTTPKPQYIGDIFNNSLTSDIYGMNRLLNAAKDIIKGGEL